MLGSSQGRDQSYESGVYKWKLFGHALYFSKDLPQRFREVEGVAKQFSRENNRRGEKQSTISPWSFSLRF